MSASNSIILLKTKGKTKDTFEYRVTEVLEYTEEFVNFENERAVSFKDASARRVFNGTRVLTSADEALTAANTLRDQIGCVEYGISFMDLKHIRFPR